jgi:hypothetical protein
MRAIVLQITNAPITGAQTGWTRLLGKAWTAWFGPAARAAG